MPYVNLGLGLQFNVKVKLMSCAESSLASTDQMSSRARLNQIHKKYTQKYQARKKTVKLYRT